MLSLDRQRKRKNIQRQRNRLISPESGSVPYTWLTAQPPFAENVVRTPHYHTANAISPPSAISTGSQWAWSSQGTSPVTLEHISTSHEYLQRRYLTEPLFQSMTGEQIQCYHSTMQQTEKVPAAWGENLLRRPVVIWGAGSKCLEIAPALRGRRLVVHSAVSILLLFIIIGTFMIAIPVGGSEENISQGPLQFLFNITSGRGSSVALISAESATATAVTVDGYDPGNTHYTGVTAANENLVAVSSDLSHFFYGQCTYWANMRYHQLTGRWIPWMGDAYEWAYQAPAYNWILSNTPNPHGYSIMVFSPDAQGSGAYGHVAVVERVNPDGSVLTSNWNWNGMWATQSWLTFYPGKGISFIWYPN